MFLKKYNEVDWINMIWDGDKWLAVVNRIMNLCIPYSAGNFLSG
jgi:hypothetical protein